MKFSQIFSNFINTGKFSGSTQEARALLDESRSVILDVTRRVESGEIAMTADPSASITPEAIKRANAARAAQGRPPLNAVEPSVIHSKTNELRTLQGRPPLKSGMQTAARPHPIFNPAPKPAAAKPAAAKPAAPAATSAPKPAASTPRAAASTPQASPARPAAAAQPTGKPTADAAKYPHLAHFNGLKGAMANVYFKKNRAEICAEQSCFAKEVAAASSRK